MKKIKLLILSLVAGFINNPHTGLSFPLDKEQLLPQNRTDDPKLNGVFEDFKGELTAAHLVLTK
jgi:hypothetical protein